MQQFAGFELPRVIIPAMARRLGITPARVRTEIRRGNWQRIARGVLLTRPEHPTRLDWAAAGLALGGPSSALSGWDALRLRGLGDVDPPRSPVLVLSRREVARVVGSVRIRQTDRPYAVTLTSANNPESPFTPIVSVARAVTDAALDYQSLRAVRALVTSAVQSEACDFADLGAELGAGPRNGSYYVRRALQDTAAGARSVAEAEAAHTLRRADIAPFEMNVEIVDERGSVIYVVDLLWRELRAALEIDSREFHFTEADWRATLVRHNELTRCGLSVMHYPPSATRAKNWTADVATWLRRRAADLGVPIPARRGRHTAGSVGPPAPFVVRRGD
ncbi:MAG: hypothetical protein ABI775_00915 [Pseudonocardiales bacterium]|nr:hypothetical protein [Actinomycetota bacterium]